VMVLAASDFAVFAGVRLVVRAVRDHAALGQGIANLTAVLVRPAFLSGWQFVSALILGLILAGTYGAADRRHDAGRIFFGVTLAALFSLYALGWREPLGSALAQFVATVLSFGPALVISRQITDQLIRRLTPRVAPSRLVLVSDPDCEWLEPAVLKAGYASRHSPLVVVGKVSVSRHSLGSEHRSLDELESLIEGEKADTVLVSGPLSDAQFASVVDTALVSGCRLLTASRTTRVAGVEPRTIWTDGYSLVELTAPSLKASQLAVKRFLDIVAASAAILLLSPLLVAIAAAVWLDSPGPVLFGQSRMGARGRLFRCYKFRSMRADAEQVLRADPNLYAAYVSNHFKLPEHQDPRLTRVGRWLRRTSLDELPQLFNVLEGQMSLVGPRPVVPEELDHYGGRAPLLLSLKPGITGTWAVNGRSEVGYPVRADMELEYVRSWSLWRDIGIMAWTVPAVMRTRGAH